MKNKLPILLSILAIILAMLSIPKLLMPTKLTKSTDNSSLVTITEDCNQKSCFDQNFKACAPARVDSVVPNGNVRYEILGLNEANDCEVLIYFTNNIQNPEYNFKEMVCPTNNGAPFDEAIIDTTVGIAESQVTCEGDLYDILAAQAN